ncbi:molecular chaperone [Brachybacterium avium]|uniref:Molecular chaperone n=1 Tax=Brachybacterium avium TaxID=2017485 RepID=A0A220UAV0_9MICO|nr:polyphosphate polymerase domain-containing protein [Brachybacterium avium]ASK65145.1 molecular chaperone [Brachybacterium avium]
MTAPCPPRIRGRFDDLAAALPGIDLGAMAERAALMTRTDRKYLVPAADAERVLQDLAEDLHVLDIDRQRTFAYRSLYYDTPDLLSYRTAATRRRRRFKVRRREYVDAGTSFLEVKTRTGRGDTEKVREEAASPSGAASALLGGDPLPAQDAAYVAARLEDAGVAVPEDPLLPALETTYRRTTLLVGSEGSRVTLDESLVWRGTDLRPYLLDDLVVLETKAAAAPGAVDRALWRSHHRPQRISKFATGIALLHPGLPANRWHRTLDRLRPQVRELATAA